MGTTLGALQGGLSIYLTIGIMFGLAGVLDMLRDRDAVRVLGIGVTDVVLVFGLGMTMWPMLIWLDNNGNGPWRG